MKQFARWSSSIIAASALTLVFVQGCKKSDDAEDAADAPPVDPGAPKSATPAKPVTASTGAACSPNGNFGCSPDGLHEVKCVNGSWQSFRACRGPKHCRIDGNLARCDYGPLMPGDVCAPPLAATCTADGKGVMGCANGRLGVIQTCVGGQTCKKDGKPATCK